MRLPPLLLVAPLDRLVVEGELERVEDLVVVVGRDVLFEDLVVVEGRDVLFEDLVVDFVVVVGREELFARLVVALVVVVALEELFLRVVWFVDDAFDRVVVLLRVEAFKALLLISVEFRYLEFLGPLIYDTDRPLLVLNPFCP